jgi:4-hydroxy-tetrahydrodipicolinate synthase
MTDLRSHLHGLWLPLVTPFRNGELDEASLSRLVRHYAELPIDGVILAATSGEGMTLGITELERVVALTRTAIAENRRYLPICLGLSGSDTRKMQDTLDETAAWPIVLYNIPYRTAVNIANETLLKLAEHRNIVGLKDCGADRAQSIDLLRRRPAGFQVLTGEDAQYFKALADGAAGAILLSAHVETETFAAVQTLLREGDREAALARWNSIADLTQLLFAEPSPAPAKHWLARTGLIASAEVRLPMVEVGPELASRLDRRMEQAVCSNQAWSAPAAARWRSR